MGHVISFNEYRYRDFPWTPDPSPRKGFRDEGRRRLTFTDRCVSNAIESFFRALAGKPLHPRMYTDGKGNVIWKNQ